MLFLTFRLGKDRYSVKARDIVEVLPLAEALKQAPQAPPGIAGLLNYHGASVPVFDLVEYATGEPYRERMNTRILLLQYPVSRENFTLLGLLAEDVVGLMKRSENEFAPSGILTPDAPYLGGVLAEGADLVQLLTPERLLPEGLRAYLADVAAAYGTGPLEFC